MSRCITTGRAGLLALLLLLPSLASAQITGQGFQVQNHGAFLGHAGTLNCGTNLTCLLVGGIVTLNASGGGGGTVTGSGTTGIATMWTNGPGSVIGDALNAKFPGTNATFGFNTAHYAELLIDGATFSSGVFGGGNAGLTFHSPADNNVPVVFFNDSDGQNNFVGLDAFGVNPTNTLNVFWGDGAGGFDPAGVHLAASHSSFLQNNFQFGAPGSNPISSPSGGFVYFDVSGTAGGPTGRSHSFLIADIAIPESTIAGASVLGLFQQDGTTSLTQIGSPNNAGTAIGGIKAEIVGNAASSTKAVSTMEVQDPQGDVSLNLFSPTNNALTSPTNVAALSLNTTQTGAGTAPYLYFPKPGGGAGIGIHAPDSIASNVLLTWPNVYPASNGQALVSTTAGAMSWATLTSGTVTSIATTAPIAGGTITTTGTISCPTCITSAVTSATGTANQITVSASTGAVTWSLPSAVTMPGSLTVTTRTGTPATMAVFTSGGVLAETTLPTSGVTSIATTSPITGGTITTTGTIACATCVTSAASLTSTAVMTGAGSQASQTPSATSTLDASGNMSLAGGLTVTGLGGGGAQMVTASNTGVLGVQAIPASPEVTSYFNIPMPTLTGTSGPLTSLTTRDVVLFDLPHWMTGVTQLSVQFSTVTTPGTFKMCIYSADGATKIVDSTITPVASSVVSASISANFTPGLYYFVVGCATTCNVTLIIPNNSPPTIVGSATPSGKLIYSGTVSHTSGTCNTTLGTITPASFDLVFRMDK